MKFRYDIAPRDGYLLVRCEGTWDAKASRECWQQVLAAFEREGLDRALVDDRDLEVETDTSIDYDHAVFVAETVSGICRKVAVVDTPKNSEPNSFFENVCVNRGLRLRFFADRLSAIEWLLP